MSEPRPLSFCRYPSAEEVAEHGVQPLPAILPLIVFERARPHRSRRYTAVPASRLTRAQVMRLAEVVGTSFARREPQCRYPQPTRLLPDGLREAVHIDPFGTTAFGPWSRENLLYWFIRLLVLTDATSPRSAVEANGEALGAQDAEAIKALSIAYPEFRGAHAAGGGRPSLHGGPVRRASEGRCLRAGGRDRRALPGAGPRLHADRGDQSVDGGSVRGARSHAGPLRAVPGAPDPCDGARSRWPTL
jgi:hypothetical protein